ncbi:hypothetical protein ACVZCY_09610 [Klebsiella grimontii]|uniref:hypothetical protein n=1 Tax=Klebsiella sp. CVUAS 5466.2 TaxID=2058159 RepID=UPI001C813C06|nr:hypothetical protein [Klebsiella sp. CVUAS 5466.2]
MLAHLSGLPARRRPLTCTRAGALRRPREQSAERLNFPEAMLAHLSGLPARRRPFTCSPGRRFAPPPGAKRGAAELPGGDADASVRATDPQTTFNL